MSLHPYFRALRDEHERSGAPALYEMSVEDARRADRLDTARAAGTPEPVARVDDVPVATPAGDVPLRVYRPRADDVLPALVYFHGGGWVVGGLETADAVCRSLANRAGCVVVAVGYRKAPESKFPAAVDDCRAATEHVARDAARLGVDAERIAVGGDSAGGNLAAAVTLLARDEGGPRLAAQLLVYPVTDYMADTQSMRDGGDPHLFNRKSMEWYWGHYLADAANATDPLASPLRAADLAGLPPALVVTAEFDPLRDEGEAYARRLEDAGVDVELVRYEGLAHGFFTMVGVLAEARAAHDRAASWLRRRFEARREPGGPA
ncbi:MAG TPA: alpha/beta hydrolase [Actinomycetota bacterium]|nr:alpha/beta hydrolase [Actinomycetota bacterium]